MKLLLGSLGSVFTSSASAAVHSACVQFAAHNVITHARQIFYAAASDHHYRVFLQIVSHAGDISSNFHAIGQPNTGDFTQSRVRLFRSGGGDFDAHAALERTASRQEYRPVMDKVESALQSRAFGFSQKRPALFSDELIDCRHKLKLTDCQLSSFRLFGTLQKPLDNVPKQID